jgi:hypothetical protein
MSTESQCYRVDRSAGALISVEEYLNTSYDPDVEYVDGALVERNVGDWLHSLTQRNLIVALTVKYPRIYSVPEFRIADDRHPVPASGRVCVANRSGYGLSGGRGVLGHRDSVQRRRHARPT